MSGWWVANYKAQIFLLRESVAISFLVHQYYAAFMWPSIIYCRFIWNCKSLRNLYLAVVGIMRSWKEQSFRYFQHNMVHSDVCVGRDSQVSCLPNEILSWTKIQIISVTDTILENYVQTQSRTCRMSNIV